MADAARTIDCVFTMLSPWAYIGHRAFLDICRRRGAAVRFRPVSLASIFPESGGLPLARRHPSRQDYRLVELQRWSERRGLSFRLHPRFWPFDPGLADRIVVAMGLAGADPEGFIAAGFSACWEGERDLADPGDLCRILDDAGHDGAALLEAARAEAVAEAYAADTRRALAEGVFGSPSYILDGEIFWGQDRLDLLDAALASGRGPFTAREAAALPIPNPIV